MVMWEAFTEDGPMIDSKHPNYVNGERVPLQRPTKGEVIDVLMYHFCADKYESRRLCSGVYEVNFHDGMPDGEWSGEIRIQRMKEE